jgi:hypothetical protein
LLARSKGDLVIQGEDGSTSKEAKAFFCLFQVDGDVLALCTYGPGLLRPGLVFKGMGASLRRMRS